MVVEFIQQIFPEHLLYAKFKFDTRDTDVSSRSSFSFEKLINKRGILIQCEIAIMWLMRCKENRRDQKSFGRGMRKHFPREEAFQWKRRT